jgi:hypothetical protein
MRQLNFAETISFFLILVWVLGFVISLFAQTPGAYWGWTRRNVGNFLQNYWRYILIFILGYYLAIEEFWRLTVPW